MAESNDPSLTPEKRLLELIEEPDAHKREAEGSEIQLSFQDLIVPFIQRLDSALKEVEEHSHLSYPISIGVEYGAENAAAGHVRGHRCTAEIARKARGTK